MAIKQGADDTDTLLADIRQRNAEEFLRRLQDLIELCADLQEHRRIRSHRDQMASVGKINATVSQMNTMTQQNVAMAEDTTAAAHPPPTKRMSSTTAVTASGFLATARPSSPRPP